MKFKNTMYLMLTAGSLILLSQLNLHRNHKNFRVGLSEAYAMPTATPTMAPHPTDKPVPQADKCMSTFNTVLAAQPDRNAYTNPMLGHVHEELYRFNKVQAADVEMIFCRMINMGVSPDVSTLPQTITKTDPRGSTITVNVTVPTETWATALGYTAKAQVSNDSTVFLTLWWAGSGTSSKGYVIQGDNPMNSDGNYRMRYIQWDLSSVDQSVNIMATQFATSFLANGATSATSKSGGDHAIYARLTYNTSTKAITGQHVEIRQDPSLASTTTTSSLKCVKTYFKGTLGGTMTGFKPSAGNPPSMALTDTAVDSTGMDGRSDVTDAATTAASAGTAATAIPTQIFDYSCNGLSNAGNSGNPFASNTVDMTLAPATVFATHN